MKEFNLFNNWHLGDNIFNIHFLNQYVNTDYVFNLYLKPEYFNEIRKHIKNTNIILHSINQGVPNNSYNLWIGNNGFFWEWTKNNIMYDLFYVDFFTMVAKHLGIENKIKNKYDMLFDNSNYEVSIPSKFDYLIINSEPLSLQFNYNENDFHNLCDKFKSENISFITTKKIKNYECTLDYKMSVVDIGHLSNNCHNIIGVNTAPIITTFTKQNIETINNRFILDKLLNFSYNEKIYRLSNLNEIYEYIK